MSEERTRSTDPWVEPKDVGFGMKASGEDREGPSPATDVKNAVTRLDTSFVDEWPFERVLAQ
jgi:hypothetical protein